MTKLEPGVYDDGGGGLHIDLDELLEAKGYEPTRENKLKVQRACAEVYTRGLGIPVVEYLD